MFSQIVETSCFSKLNFFKASYTIAICSQQPGIFSIQPFCIEVLMIYFSQYHRKSNDRLIDMILGSESGIFGMQAEKTIGHWSRTLPVGRGAPFKSAAKRVLR